MIDRALPDRKTAHRTLERRAGSVTAAIRLNDWWDYKLTPPLALFCATVLHTGQSLLSCWPAALALVAAVAVCAAYVSLINDYFDRDEDARSGRPERLSRGEARFTAPLIAACTLGGALFLMLWRDSPAVAAAYLGSWIAFTLYSAPPLRLKTRGLAGMIADAAGASVFPFLLAVLLALQATSRPAEPLWLAAAAAWAFGWGLRGIAWHQVGDLQADRAGGVATFASRHGSLATARLTRWVALPFEMSGLMILLWWTQSVAPLLFLLFYLALVAARARVRTGQGARPLLLDEYYDGLLPVALVLASARTHPADLWLLVPLLLLFGRRARDAAKEAVMIAAIFAGGGWVARLRRIRRRLRQE